MNRLLVLLLIVSLLTACNDSPRSANNTAPVSQTPASSPTSSPSPLTELEEALRYVRNGGYTYIWVISRKDGKPLDGADSDFLRKNAPQVVDWAKVNNENKKFVGGTNFNLEEGNLEALKKRFVTEDYSGR
jgi:hypothetical protein